MPRCKSDIWERFERIQKGACFKAKCKDCGITMQGIVERMKNHIAKTCSGSNPSNEDIVIPNDVSTAAVSSEAATTSSEPTTYPIQTKTAHGWINYEVCYENNKIYQE